MDFPRIFGRVFDRMVKRGVRRDRAVESAAAVDLERRPDPPEIDLVDEAGFESFPASDPPAHSR